MDSFRNKKFIYDEILKMEDIYNNSTMQDIKENLFQIKIQKKEKYKKHCKRNNLKIGKFRLFEDIDISESAEKAYTNSIHPSKIPFMTLMKICAFLKVDIEELTKSVKDREKRESYAERKWTEEMIRDFISMYNQNELEEISQKYEISLGTVLRYYSLFTEGKDVNGIPRK